MSSSESDVDRLVAEYVTEMAREPLVGALRELATYEYPVDDRSFLRARRDELDERIAAILDLLEPTDFPLVGPRNAFDKLVARSKHPLLPWVSPALEIPEEQVERPSIKDIYEQTFGPICGAEAYAEYAQALRGGAREIQAVLRGHHAGQRCQEALRRRFLDWLEQWLGA